ncbi:MAG: cell division protein CrgA [Actinomycetales bacterium]|nr:cell division protein CrgA [Actinomycetales bacterium]
MPPAAKAAAKRAAAEQEARRRARAEAAPNPTWWAPVFVTLLVLGLIWIVVFYVTQGAWPIQAFGYWNLIVGFGLLLTGFAMTMKWK